MVLLGGLLICGSLYASKPQAALRLEHDGLTVEVVGPRNLDGSVNVRVFGACGPEKKHFIALQACDIFEGMHDVKVNIIALIKPDGDAIIVSGW